ncbi:MULTISPECIES: DUF3565 domain-containing protein [unclassified Pseudomonas]|uniref:DUF3565 domain-containing protein n=1 Tax=unclassified Pseudomonas TaxID=196821 RepID=UPI00244BC89B|nr:MULTISPECIES: DUF3565 domain-containing protein [unclassified Pseudomonas]MDG9930787.1 DUF3565 domain-containing protein [Pseudomonas sp. GD04042]MDH0485176.1 DUF3565 domain-containing protein [Pseudomonas sp. GD04015]MDH0607170.1 DUF3565 domain-containing protein [Pseudomonas sp. GD03869]
MDTALLAAICMEEKPLQESGKGASLPAAPPESDRGTDGRTPWVLGFHRDEDGHWVADLSCGHTQHLRHLPPWQNRAWVTDPRERERHLGQPFPCGWCAAERANNR